MSRRLPYLDLLRGLAALAVCAGHLRAFMFVDYGQVTAPGILCRLGYFLTGLGHQAVVVFFVLSGYLVGGSVLAAHQAGRWSWTQYALRRLTRLWVVLVPALALTLALDLAGRHWGRGYDGSFHALYNSGPTPGSPADLGAAVFLGNALFLQTIKVNCFGTNGPLWSLANEFWYYALFPLLCGAWFALRAPARSLGPVVRGCGCALLFAALLWWLPAGLTLAGLIWLMGAGAFWAGRFGQARRICARPAWLLGAGAAALGSLAASKTSSPLGTDFAVGAAFALWLAGLAGLTNRRALPDRLVSRLSDLSYTLYLVHFPLLAFVFFGFAHGRQLQPGLWSWLWFGAMLAGTVAFAAGMWWCFERNTDRVRRRIELLARGVGSRLARFAPDPQRLV